MECFVYGTLTDRETAATVLDSFEYRESATLSGLERVDGEYPTLAPGESVTGRILETDEVAALDRYEGVDRDLYVRLSVPLETGGFVETYVGDPEALDAPAEWPGDGSFEERVRAHLDENEVLVRAE
ncbi:gamma-glutamylcyclotransferase [Halovenus rubra]|uniref:Gamma-glutamylcyclotransferase n=2 Tax=Halovenus rubra TaxID=869890 RepID=A0ACC7DWJ9_9EURY|nr:gamma-glutamylcyclotransferase family protein [Halovenus rubra]